MDRRTWRVAFTTLVLAAVAATLGGLGFMFSGAYNVAAAVEHTSLTRWALATTQERSVRARATTAPEAPQFDSSLVAEGFAGFRAMCVECHGAPGVDRGVTGQGLNPRPPNLSEEAAEMSDRELFWVTKNGIKFTGMPAFGVTHSDEEIWGLVAFMRQLADLSADDYARMVAEHEARIEAGAEPAGHTHAPGTPEHED